MSDSKHLVTSVKVQINARASLVWHVLVDLDSYPQWNPYKVRVESTSMFWSAFLHAKAPVELVGGSTNESIAR